MLSENKINARIIQLEKENISLKKELNKNKKLAERIVLLTENEKQLRNIIATKDKFFSIIAHDLKNPFHQMLGFIDILIENIDKYDNRQIEKIVLYLNKSAYNGYKLLENLLEWSRAQTDNIKFEPEKVNIVKIIEEEIEFVRENAENKRISIITDFLFFYNYVFVDLDMLKTILRNLISNALKFTLTGGEIFISIEHSDKFSKIKIKDNGIGIPIEKINRLFRIDKVQSTPGTNNEHGTGLGLILCKEFVNKNGGKIFVDSEPGQGSTFSFTLPKI